GSSSSLGISRSRNKAAVVTMENPGSPRPKARQVRSKIKVMLIVFLDADGIVHHEYAPWTRQ
ncbi:hypothetical protein TNCV_538871, partial [Trichonephila clavipes]